MEKSTPTFLRRNMEGIMEKRLLTLKETCEYLSIKETFCRKLIKKENFGIKIGGRLYADKKKLDRWINEHSCNIA